MERGCQQNDRLADGYSCHFRTGDRRLWSSAATASSDFIPFPSIEISRLNSGM